MSKTDPWELLGQKIMLVIPIVAVHKALGNSVSMIEIRTRHVSAPFLSHSKAQTEIYAYLFA